MAHTHGYHDEGAAAAVGMASWAVALFIIMIVAAVFIGLLLWSPWRTAPASPTPPAPAPGIQQPAPPQAPAPGGGGTSPSGGVLIGNHLYV